MKIISGGQTGVDLAGLEAAEEVGLPTGGFMPAGWRTDEGPRPEYEARFGLQCTTSPNYPPRTRQNVKTSDVTVILGDHRSRGCRLTINLCRQYGKSVYVIDRARSAKLAPDLASWLSRFDVINIAGNRERTNPGINSWAKSILVPTFKILKRRMT